MEYEEIIITLSQNKQGKHKVKRMQSKFHELQTVTDAEIYCFDNKRYILSDGIKALTYGHKETN